jgi:hypothetical protein
MKKGAARTAAHAASRDLHRLRVMGQGAPAISQEVSRHRVSMVWKDLVNGRTRRLFELRSAQ